MEYRMSVRIPTRQRISIKPRFGQAVAAELRDVSFDGAFLVPADKLPGAFFQTPVRLMIGVGKTPEAASIEIPARVVRTHADGVALAFGAYGDTVDDYLEQLYRNRLASDSGAVSLAG